MARAPTRFPTHGPELRALLAACHREPDDDTPRLVLADWLQEHDDPRGELVRLQCQLTDLPAGDPEYDTLFEQHRAWWESNGGLWEKECGGMLSEPGPHDRGLPTVGRYDEHDGGLSAGALGDPQADRLSATIAAGWPRMAWVSPPARGKGAARRDDDWFAPFGRAPWAGSPAPVGFAFPPRSRVTAALLGDVAKIPHLRGLSLARAKSAEKGLYPRIAALTRLEYLDLGPAGLSDIGLQILGPLKRLRTIIARSPSPLSVAGLRTMAQYFGLRELRLGGAGLTPSKFSTIGQMTRLEVLDVPGADDTALRNLYGLTRLRELDLTGAPVSGRGLEHFPRLTDLALGRTALDDTGMSYLAGLTRLQVLDLSHTRITGASLRHLSALRWLKRLDMSGTKIGDADLVHLEGLTGLEHIGLTGSHATEAGAVRLKKKLPKVSVQM